MLHTALPFAKFCLFFKFFERFSLNLVSNNTRFFGKINNNKKYLHFYIKYSILPGQKKHENTNRGHWNPVFTLKMLVLLKKKVFFPQKLKVFKKKKKKKK